MRIGFIQMTPVLHRVEVNLEKAKQLFQQIEADLIVLPECFNTGYIFKDKEELSYFAENIPDGPTCLFLKDVAQKRHVVIVAGLPEKKDNRFYNSAVMITPEGTCFSYRKTHLFDREKEIFSPGNSGFRVFNYQEVNIGMMICFDWIFPESARTLALNGADIIAHPSNLVLPYCPKAMVTRALENHVFCITCNRSGQEVHAGYHHTYIGQSRVISPSGEILIEAGGESEYSAVVEINPAKARRKYITERNHLFTDRRPDMYHSSLS